MRKSLYPKLAWNGIQKNKRLYLPYILTCVGMVMIYYILAFLSDSQILGNAKGGSSILFSLDMGAKVIAFFAVIFLFYTNSFLNKRRKKEFGLYNILGMEKSNLACVLLFESLIISAISLVGGLTAGIAFSKLSELCMINLMKAEVDFRLYIEGKAVVETIMLFVIIFLLLLMYTLCQIKLAKPIELLRGEHFGEKPPKANWLLALEGLVILAVAYYMALSIENPLAAIANFFMAVLLVVIATYSLFIAGSVVLCRLLQKNKNYYYKTNHFVSVSSMVFRMKRNGAGLASICILCTMVLVILSSTLCLYIGAEDSLRNRYTRNIIMRIDVEEVAAFTSKEKNDIKGLINQMVAEKEVCPENVLDFSMLFTIGVLENENYEVTGLSERDISEVYQAYFVPVEDYNRIMNKEEVLAEHEVLVYTTEPEKMGKTLSFGDKVYDVKKIVPEFLNKNFGAMQVIPTIFIFVSDYQEVARQMLQYKDEEGKTLNRLQWFYGFDLDCNEELQIEICDQLTNQIQEEVSKEGSLWKEFGCDSVAKERAMFYGMYGGLLFLGILLGIVFVVAAVLIIYYKQISEGYEDQSRFAIMQKVGMSKEEIQRSINSQVLTVFFLPIVTAGIHLFFAFPLIQKVLALIDFYNMGLQIMVTLMCFIVFGIFYFIVYFATSKAYFSIVSGAKSE
ncbi:MAG: FtsX-like permease family protein [Lachnospiraceae bacterium]|nr:FtsX-like permease family protein [Lachnospiraceae bacterium]